MTDGQPRTPKGSSFVQRSKERFKKMFSRPQSRASSPQSQDQVESVQVQHSADGDISGSRLPAPASSTSVLTGTAIAQDQRQHNTLTELTQDGVTSTSSAQLRGKPSIVVTLADQETSASRALSTAKDVAGVTWSFTEVLLKRLPTVLDPNPIKIAAAIVKIVIEIKNEVKGNIDAVDQRILLTVNQLDTVEKALAGWKPNKAEEQEGLKLYQTTLQTEWTNLMDLNNRSIIRKIAAHEEDKEKIVEVFERINQAREQLVLVTGLRVHRFVSAIDDKVTQLRLEQLKPSHMADHKFELMGEQRHLLRRAVCTPGTRVRILGEIVKWANDTSSESQTVYWLSGQVGSGKTTIAYTIARRFEFAGDAEDTITLGGNFFCSRQIEEARSAAYIIRTIVYHLAFKYPPFAEALVTSGKFDTINHGVRAQLESLLIEPWKQAQLASSSPPPPFLIVIDALDEIEGTGGSEFLRDLLDIISKHHLPGLKFFATSRPDPNLVTHLGSFEDKRAYRLEQVSSAEAQGDITTYLNANLPAFVGRPEMEKLVMQAAGLFIFAATVVRFLAGCTPREQKRRLGVLPFVPGSLAPPTSEDSETPLLDALYMQILSQAFQMFNGEERLERLQILHTFLCSAECISTSVAAELLFPSEDDPVFSSVAAANDVLANLHAVLYQENNKVLSYHKSFTDFIFNSSRAKEFACDETTHHQLLTNSCFSVMGQLRFNIAGIETSYILDQDNSALSEAVKRNITPVLSYSCQNWDYHLLAVQAIDAPPYYDILLAFLQLPALFWMEAMNLLGLQGQCQQILQRVERWVSNNNLILKQRLANASSFALYFSGSGAALSTPHLYLSALATWPQDSGQCHEWRKHFPSIPKFKHASANDQPLMTFNVGNPVRTVAFSNDGKNIVAGSDDYFLRVWDASTGQMLKILEGHTDMISSVVFSNNGKYIVSGSCDKTVRVWDVSTGQMLRILEGHIGRVISVTFSNDEKYIVSGSEDTTVQVWDASTGQVLKILEDYLSDRVRSVAFSNDGKYIVSGSDDAMVRIWDVSTGQILKYLEGHTDCVKSVAFSSDGRFIVSGSDDTTVRIWDASVGQMLRVLQGHTSMVKSVACSNDGKYIVSGSYDMTVQIWDASTGQMLKVLKGHASTVQSVAFSSDGRHIVSGSYDGSVWVWAHDAFQVIDQVPRIEQDHISVVAFSKDGKYIVSGSKNTTVQVWDTTTGQMLKVLEGHTDSVQSVAFSNDGKFIVSSSHDMTVCIWDASTGQMLKVLDHSNWAISVAFSSDGRKIVSGSVDGSVRVWDASTGQILKKLEGHTASVHSVAFSNDGRHILSGSLDGSVRVWDVSTGQLLKILLLVKPDNPIREWIMSVAFSSDGRHIVSISHCVAPEQSIQQIWDLSTGQMLRLLEGHYTHTSTMVYSVAFSSDGRHIVSGSGGGNNSVQVWDVFTGQTLKILNDHTNLVKSVAFSSDGKYIVSSSLDKTIRVWALYQEQATLSYVQEKATDISGHKQHTGWLLSPNKQHYIMFVPLAANLPDPSNILTLPLSYAPSLDITSSTLGSEWSKCFYPQF